MWKVSHKLQRHLYYYVSGNYVMLKNLMCVLILNFFLFRNLGFKEFVYKVFNEILIKIYFSGSYF